LSIGSSALFNGVNAFFNSIRVAQLGNEETDKGVAFICDLNQNGVAGDSEDGEVLSCNFLSWKQLLHYLDWIGMRPMTELEFEKACRGPLRPIPREFAFGSANVIDANQTIFDSTEFEQAVSEIPEGFGIASHGYLGRSGPLRNGFAANDTTDKLSSGASYWGVMELSGNLWEQTMGVSKANGLLFEGSHGDGDMSSLPSDWRFESSIVRGGAWSSGVFAEFRDLAVSDRFYYDLESEIARNTTGGRGVLSTNNLSNDE